MTPEPTSQVAKSLLSIDTQVLTMVYEDLAKPGVQQVGKALSTVLGLGNTVLLPLKLVNEKSKLWYAKHMEHYRKQLEQIPEDNVIEVAPEIGVPILEKLEKTTSEKVSELYINLLTNASTVDFVANTHPRFVSIIENLTSDEIKLLELIKSNRMVPFITIIIRLVLKEAIKNPEILGDFEHGGIGTLNHRATMFEKNNVLSLPDKAKFYFQNLEGLGLITAETERFMGKSAYYPLYEAFGEDINPPEDNSTTGNAPSASSARGVEKGMYKLTEIGRLFMKACAPQPKRPT